MATIINISRVICEANNIIGQKHLEALEIVIDKDNDWIHRGLSKSKHLNRITVVPLPCYLQMLEVYLQMWEVYLQMCFDN